MADNMSKLSINPNLMGFGFYYKFLPIINFREMAANFVILGNG